MIFRIPDAPLTSFLSSALVTMQNEAATEYNTLVASLKADPTLGTVETAADLDALKGFDGEVNAVLESRRATGDRLASHTSELALATEPAVEPVTPATPAPAVPVAPAAPPVASVAELAAHIPSLEAPTGTAEPAVVFGRMYAGANVEGFPADAELKDLGDLAKAFLSKGKSFAGLAAYGRSTEPTVHPVAYVTRDYPKNLSVFGVDEDDATLREVTNEFALDGGSLLRRVEKRRAELATTDPTRDGLVAATGWCAPSETLYDTCFQGVVDGIIDVPEVQARRGGIRHNQGIDFSGVFGGGTGFFNLSEAQVISGTTKSCIEIPCPTFIDDRLGVTGLCITGNILQNRGYPEFVRDWMRAAMVASAHQINSLQIAAMVADSTAVDLTASPAFASDLTVTSQILAAIDLAITDIKYRLRMGRSATLEVVLPWWVLAQFRADLSRQNGVGLDKLSVTDSQIVGWFSLRNARVQWVYDWQDSFAPTDVVGPDSNGNAPGAATAIQALPTGVKFLVYPAGTWVRAVNDVINLSAIYDSTKLATNQLTQLFTETGWKMMRMCPLSRIYTVPICPSGNTGAQREVTCAVV